MISRCLYPEKNDYGAVDQKSTYDAPSQGRARKTAYSQEKKTISEKNSKNLKMKFPELFFPKMIYFVVSVCTDQKCSLNRFVTFLEHSKVF